MYIVSNCLLARITNKRLFQVCKNYKVLGDYGDIFSCSEEMRIKTADIILFETDLLSFQEIEVIKILKNNFPLTKIIIKTTQKNKDKMLLTLSRGVSGYTIDNNIDVKKIVDVVTKGGFWLDINIAKDIFSCLAELNTRTNEKLEETKYLKNSLTQRELEVLKLITQGKTNSQIAQEIIVSTNTAKAHVGSILTKLSASDRVQAAVKATKANLF